MDYLDPSPDSWIGLINLLLLLKAKRQIKYKKDIPFQEHKGLMIDILTQHT